MAKKLTANQQEYKKQLKRITNALRKEERKGYDVSEIREKLEEAPSRITKRYLETLKDITPKYIRAHSTFVETPTQPVYTNGNIIDYISPEPVPLTAPPSPAPPEQDYEYAYYRDEILGHGGREFYMYNAQGEIVSKIEPIYEVQNKNREDQRTIITGYIDELTGEVFEDRQAVQDFIKQQDLTKTDRFFTSGNYDTSIPDLTDYAISQIYEQTTPLDTAAGNIMHPMFDAVRERIGDEGFYKGMTDGNGFRSAFHVFQQTLHSGGGYPEAFTKFGAQVIKDLPVTDEEAQALETAFNEIIFAAYGVDVE